MKKVTGLQVKQAMIEKNITKIVLRECSMCGTPLYYLRDGEDLYFNTACDCVSYQPPPEPRSWESVAEIINMQTVEKWRNGYMSMFGLEP